MRLLYGKKRLVFCLQPGKPVLLLGNIQLGLLQGQNGFLVGSPGFITLFAQIAETALEKIRMIQLRQVKLLLQRFGLGKLQLRFYLSTGFLLLG